MSVVEISKYRGLPYRFASGPSQDRSYEILTQAGINCQFLAHLMLQDWFGINLPVAMRSKEMFEDGKYFDEIEDVQKSQFGDLFFFGKESLVDLRKLHVAIHSGHLDENTGSPNLIHANYIDLGVSIWPSERFGEYLRYQRLYGIRRLKVLQDIDRFLLEDRLSR